MALSPSQQKLVDQLKQYQAGEPVDFGPDYATSSPSELVDVGARLESGVSIPKPEGALKPLQQDDPTHVTVPCSMWTKETPKAWKVLVYNVEVWAPKSQCDFLTRVDDGGDGHYLRMPRWAYKRDVLQSPHFIDPTDKDQPTPKDQIPF